MIGLPHLGRAALRMLEEEGFTYDRYVDISTAGRPSLVRPTASARCDRRSRRFPKSGNGGRTRMLGAAGRLGQFRAGFGSVRRSKKGVVIDEKCAELLDLKVGETS